MKASLSKIVFEAMLVGVAAGVFLAVGNALYSIIQIGA